MSEPKRLLNPSYVAVLLATAWLAAIALMKLFAGNPGDLPRVVLDHTPFEATPTFALVIAVELSVALVALLRPRVGWVLLAGLYLVFEAVLAALIAAGAKSCGCAGGAITISPLVMCAIDTTLLLLLVASRPWKNLVDPRVPAGALVALVAVAIGFPWFKVEQRAGGETPAFLVLHPDRWVGQMIFDAPELVAHLEPADVEKLPTDGLVLLWRQSCDHCRDHLIALANDKVQHDGSKPIVLVQLRDDLDKSSQVEVFPEGAHVTRLQFKVGPTFAIQTPWELHVEGGTITKALDAEQSKAPPAGR